MKILIVGGTGMIGAHAALRLRDAGHAVVIAARKPAPEGSAPAQLPFKALDYVNDTPDTAWLSQFDAVVFTAGNDVRHVPEGSSMDAHWERANSEAVPRFLAQVKAAGVPQAILIGSFYPQAAPHLVAGNPYIASRKAADERSRALADDTFRIVSLNAPIVLGHVPGVPTPAYEAYVLWAQGLLPGAERFAIAGGCNVIGCDTLTDAIVAALDRGRNGKAYLIGDENLTWKRYLELFLEAVGDTTPLEVRDQEHPLLPDFMLFAGRGGSIYYDVDPVDMEELGYRRNDVARTAKLIADAYTCK